VSIQEEIKILFINGKGVFADGRTFKKTVGIYTGNR